MTDKLHFPREPILDNINYLRLGARGDTVGCASEGRLGAGSALRDPFERSGYAAFS